MSLALLFPGQGTQHPAMLQWLDDQPEAADVLGRLIAQLGGDWRRRQCRCPNPDHRDRHRGMAMHCAVRPCTGGDRGLQRR
jgi:hypothetical protein